MYKIEHISASASKSSGYWRVVKKGKELKKFYGDFAQEDAQNYVAGCVEDDQWAAANRD